MDLKKLNYVIAVAEERSISKAAEKLYVSQPSLSKYIITIETELGVQLFDRKSTPLKLTYAGEKYVKAAREILSIEQKTDAIINDIKNVKKSRITVGIPLFRGARLLPNILKHYWAKFPEVEVKILESTSSDLEKLTIEGKIDFSVIWLPIDSTQLEAEKLFTENLVLAVPPGYVFANGESVENYRLKNNLNLRDCGEEPFVLLTKGQKLRYFADCMFVDEGFSPNCILETYSVETAYNMVAASLGLSILYNTDFQFSYNTNNIKDCPIFFPIKSDKYYSSMAAVYRRGGYLSKASMQFIETVKEIYCKK